MLTESSYESKRLDRDGLKMGDKIEFRAFLKRKTVFELKRTKLDFVTDGRLSELSQASVKLLGQLGKERLAYRLSVVECMTDTFERKSRYLFESLGTRPFSINGNLCLKSYIFRGDKIKMGMNELLFQVPVDEAELFGPKLSTSVMRSELPLLIYGETGVGKSTLAKKVHQQTSTGRPFVQINIASYSPALLESELFGHAKGAFTGASRDKKGALREANGGTLFLDEIDSLPRETQTKLLLFLDNKRVRPVGADRDFHVECRLIFASGQKLSRLVEKGDMRKDFYYRISSGHEIEILPLRTRPDLLRELCEAYLRKKGVRVSPSLLDFYQQQCWPGNLRQLYSHLDKKVELATGKYLEFNLEDESLLEHNLSTIVQLEEFRSLQEVKESYIKRVYLKSNSNLTVASKYLKVAPNTVKRVVGMAR